MPSFCNVRPAGRWDCSTRRMISSFSEAGYLIPRRPHPRSCLWNGPPLPPGEIVLSEIQTEERVMKICSASHRSRRERVQYCRFGRIRCRRPAAAGSAGHAHRPSGKTSGLHCRHGGVLRRPSSWSAVHNTGAQRPFDVTEVCAATIPVVVKGACRHCARSDATAITRTADRPGDADLVVRALALLEGLCRITRRRLSNRRPPVARSPPRQLLCAPRATGDMGRASGPTGQGQATAEAVQRAASGINAQAAARPACRAIGRSPTKSDLVGH